MEGAIDYKHSIMLRLFLASAGPLLDELYVNDMWPLVTCDGFCQSDGTGNRLCGRHLCFPMTNVDATMKETIQVQSGVEDKSRALRHAAQRTGCSALVDPKCDSCNGMKVTATAAQHAESVHNGEMGQFW